MKQYEKKLQTSSGSKSCYTPATMNKKLLNVKPEQCNALFYTVYNVTNQLQMKP